MTAAPPRPARRLTRAAAVLSAPALLLGAATAAQAAAGDLDPTWSGDGVATQGAGAGTAYASAGLPDGRLVVAGTGTLADGTPSNGGTYVSRYTAAGELDTTFGTGGTTKISVAPGAEFVRDVVVDTTGKVLVGGYVAASDYPDETDVFVARLDATGKIDTTFGGGDGIVLLDRSNHDRGGALAVKGSRILVGSGVDTGGNWGLQWTVTALTAAGSVDTTFSGDGSAEVPVSLVGSFDSLRDLAVQSDGKIVLGGSSGTEFASARLTATGAMDTTYSGDGVARAVVEYGGAGAKVLVQSDKKVVVVGYATGTGRSDTDLAAVRFTAAGALDPTFSGDGRALIDLGARRNERATSASLAADGKIVLVGSAESAVGMDSAIARLDWDGTVDTSFSGDGLTTVDTLGTSNEQLETVAVTATGAIRSAGSNLSGWTLLGHDGSASTNVSVADASVLEPDTGTVNATFTVTLSSPSPTPVTVKWKTAPGTATAPADFTTRSGTVTFPAGVTSRPVTVPVVGDTVREADETFSVLLSLPTNAGIADGTAVGTVRNDD